MTLNRYLIRSDLSQKPYSIGIKVKITRQTVNKGQELVTRLRQFSQDGNKALLKISGLPKGEVKAKLCSLENNQNELKTLDSGRELKIKHHRKGAFCEIQIDLNEVVEPADTEYLVILYVTPEEGGYSTLLKFVRQSQEFLYSSFNYFREGGYWIYLGGAMDIGMGPKTRTKKVKKFYGLAEVPEIVPTLMSPPPDEILASAKLELAQLWTLVADLENLGLLTGPTNGDSVAFEDASFGEKIQILRENTFAVQCSGFRDLFAHLAITLGHRVRLVDAFNHDPIFPDLIAYGHSTAEVYLQSLKKWVLFDPWFGGMIITSKGSPLGIGDFPLVKTELPEIAHWTAFDQVSRRIIRGDGSTVHNNVSLQSLSMVRSTFGPLNSLQPPYLSYFVHVILRNVRLVNRNFFIKPK